jgi:hypothetical protein
MIPPLQPRRALTHVASCRAQSTTMGTMIHCFLELNDTMRRMRGFDATRSETLKATSIPQATGPFLPATRLRDAIALDLKERQLRTQISHRCRYHLSAAHSRPLEIGASFLLPRTLFALLGVRQRTDVMFGHPGRNTAESKRACHQCPPLIEANIRRRMIEAMQSPVELCRY